MRQKIVNIGSTTRGKVLAAALATASLFMATPAQEALASAGCGYTKYASWWEFWRSDCWCEFTKSDFMCKVVYEVQRKAGIGLSPDTIGFNYDVTTKISCPMEQSSYCTDQNKPVIEGGTRGILGAGF